MDIHEMLLTIRFPARPDRLGEVREAMRDVARQKNWPTEFGDSMVLAVNEACANIIQHAYKDKDSGDIVLEIFYNGDEVLVRLTDFAEPIDIASCISRPLGEIRPGGLGLHFMNELMDEVRFLRGQAGAGNLLCMKKKIKRTWKKE